MVARRESKRVVAAGESALAPAKARVMTRGLVKLATVSKIPGGAGGYGWNGDVDRPRSAGSPLYHLVNIPHIGFMSAICVDSAHAMGLCA